MFYYGKFLQDTVYRATFTIFKVNCGKIFYDIHFNRESERDKKGPRAGYGPRVTSYPSLVYSKQRLPTFLATRHNNTNSYLALALTNNYFYCFFNTRFLSY